MSAEATAHHRVIDPSVLYLGTPVYLVGTRNPNGTTNLAPASSHFALGRMIVLGLEEGGQSLDNLRRHPELTVNFPSAAQWQQVERLAGVTGKNPVPDDKAGQYEFEPRKFARAGLTAVAGDLVSVDRAADTPIQLEARVRRITEGVQGIYGMVEAEVVRVHAHESVTVAGTDHIDPEAWHPLIYAYRHFYDRGAEVGWTRKSPIAQAPAAVERWELSGGTWRIASIDGANAGATADADGAAGATAVVELRRCDGGEVADRVTLSDPRDVRWARVQLAISAGEVPPAA